ncbi:hypothetical protein H5410_062476 [Solanum commersonii]|uniref:Uncharacterized protein n=1 Tax=Solanum commersonii TaxID=4109 RepID=A0A9J5WCS4_SOLCO|nr:hypothetical protein H5410_062476 [Solanum commersonii]
MVQLPNDQKRTNDLAEKIQFLAFSNNSSKSPKLNNISMLEIFNPISFFIIFLETLFCSQDKKAKKPLGVFPRLLASLKILNNQKVRMKLKAKNCSKRNKEKDNGKKEVRNANGVSENEGKSKKLHELGEVLWLLWPEFSIDMGEDRSCYNARFKSYDTT